MKTAVALTMAAGAASQDILFNLSPDQEATVIANWNRTVEEQGKRGKLSSSGSCSKDFRKDLPACLQYEPEWCWATAVAEMAHFYKPKDYPENGSDCHGVECKIVSNKKDGTMGSCCSPGCGSEKPICCKNVLQSAECEKTCGAFSSAAPVETCTNQAMKVCGDIAGNPDDITTGIEFIAGKKYKYDLTGPLPQEKLDKLMTAGHPVLLGVRWKTGGGHALTLAGCGDGKYYLHDPGDHAGVYQTLTYDQVVSYVPPENKMLDGMWFMTVFLEGDDTTTAEEIAV